MNFFKLLVVMFVILVLILLIVVEGLYLVLIDVGGLGEGVWKDEGIDFGCQICLFFVDCCFFCYGLDEFFCEVEFCFDFCEEFFMDCGGYQIVKFGDLDVSEFWLWIVLDVEDFVRMLLLGYGDLFIFEEL